jgi:protein subunit release factor B
MIIMIFPVSEEKNRWLQERMEALGIHEKDIEEKFIRSSGKGGQKVNKTSTCVYLKHIPTGIEVKWIEKLSGQLTPEDIKIEKAKRQKLKRRKRARMKYSL